jgi:hypothetical protein
MRRILGALLFSSALLIFAPVVGCDGSRPDAPAETVPADRRASLFEPARTGTIQGTLRWSGPVPEIPFLTSPPDPLAGPVLRHRQTHRNPNSPQIDSRSRAIMGGAIVFLKGIDPKKSKPWDRGPALVEQRDCQYHVMQDGEDGHIGIVQCGDEVEMISRDRWLYVLHADGAVYFSLTFVDPNLPRKRTLPEKGIVELSSSTGYYWMRAYLFVDDHPYYALPGKQGQFSLSQVPEGDYQLLAWLPNWRILRHERDPESAVVARIFFQPAAQKSVPVHVHRGDRSEVAITVSDSDFAVHP